MKSKPLWAVILLALAAAVVAFVTTFLNGCSVAVHGRLASWAALEDKVPPPVPPWAQELPQTQQHVPTTQPTD